MSAFMSFTRYCYYMFDFFEGCWVECSEKDFNDCVVRFRGIYDLKYEDHSQVFYNIGTGYPEFKRVPVGEYYEKL